MIEVLETLNGDETSEEIQSKIYEIGKKLNFENLRDWFKAFYEVILGQAQGPRIGSFIKFYGITETLKLLKKTHLE